MNQHHWDPAKDVADTLELDKPLLDCVEVAEWLEMKGRRMVRFCPACQAHPGHDTPSLALGNTTYQCYNCNIRGDARDLVRMVLRCSEVKADRWINEQQRKASSGPVASMKDLEVFNEELVPEPDRVLAAFLDRCRHVPVKLLAMMEDEGISLEVIAQSGMRYYPRNPAAINEELEQLFGSSALLASGLVIDMCGGNETTMSLDEASVWLEDELTINGADVVRWAFQPYDDANVPYLVLPYYKEGKVTHIEARPLVQHKVLQAKGLPPRLGTGLRVPYQYNCDVLESASRVLVFRRELDAMVAQTLEHNATAYVSLSMFRGEWVDAYRDKDVIFVIEESRANDRRMAKIDRMFEGRGLPTPKRLLVNARMPMRNAIAEAFISDPLLG